MNPQNDDHEVVLSLSDFFAIAKRNKKSIFRSSVVCGALILLYAISRPMQFGVEGTFKEKAKAEGPATGISLLLSGEKENPAIAMIKSRRIIGDAIKNLSFQATIEPEEQRWFFFRHVADFAKAVNSNLKVEFAYLKGSQYPSIRAEPSNLGITNLTYEGEIPLSLTVEVCSDTAFAVYEKHDKIGYGTFNEPFTGANASFTITKSNIPLAAHERYTLNIKPLEQITKRIAKQLKIVADYNANSFLSLKLTYTSKHGASDLLNGIMHAYRNYLIAENHNVVTGQIEYLQKRQIEVDASLAELMEKHAEQVSTHAGNLDLLVSTQQNLQRRLLSIDLEMKQLNTALQSGNCQQIQAFTDSASQPLYTAIGEIHKYKQQCDTLELMLRGRGLDATAMGIQWQQHIADLKEVDGHTMEAKTLLKCLESGLPLPKDTDLYRSDKYLVSNWERHIGNGEVNNRNFKDYLKHLVHLLEVEKTSIENRLTHQQTSHPEFKGIDLDTAKGLYMSYSRELQELEINCAQHEFLINKLMEPEFELSSLATVLSDPISREIISKASSTTLALQDTENRTTREMERLSQELGLHKNFLSQHLEEARSLLQLKAELLKNKIVSVQGAILELTQERISLQEKQIFDHGTGRISSLEQEKAVILHQKKDLQAEFDKIPQQWATEKIVDLYLQTQGSLMQQIGNLIESKNIADHIDVTLSTPFDLATPPLHPNSPHLILLTLLASFLGAFGSLVYFLGHAAFYGPKATVMNLQLSGQHVCGELDIECEGITLKDLSIQAQETLRRMLQFILGDKPAKSMLIIEGQYPSFAPLVCEMLSKRGLKVLLQPAFDDVPSSPADVSLLSSLENGGASPTIVQESYGHRLIPGQKSLHANDLLHSSKYRELKSHYENSYDLFLVCSTTTATGAESESLTSLFDKTIMTLSEETLTELKPFMASKGHIAFTTRTASKNNVPHEKFDFLSFLKAFLPSKKHLDATS